MNRIICVITGGVLGSALVGSAALLTLFNSLIGIVLLTTTGLSQAQQAYPYYPGYTPYPYAYPAPAPQSPQTQQQPGYTPYGAYPGQQPAYGAWPPSPYGQLPSRAGTEYSSPRVTVTLSNTTVYVQQPLLLKLEITSKSNISTLYPELPKNSGMIFKQLDGPTTSSSGEGGKRQITNRLRYAMTPIYEGNITLPVIGIKGDFSSPEKSGKSDFEATSEAPIKLEVLPINPSVQPWLPLHGLVIQTLLQNAERPEAGKPLTLVVDISAAGATGSQLPSLEGQLEQGDFRVYREKSKISGNISNDGHHLLGRRTETFTLVPQRGGAVQIPELNIAWWNVDTRKREIAGVPSRQLQVKGDEGVKAKSKETVGGALFTGTASLFWWLLLITLFAAIAGFLVTVWLRRRRSVQIAGEELTTVVLQGFFRVSTFFTWLAPIRRLQRLRQLFVGKLPRSFRLWFCIRLVNGETDPETWAYMLRFLTNKHLDIPTYLPLPELGSRLAAIHPHSREMIMEEMMQILDNALYNGGNIEFTSWKQRFRRELRPALLRRKRSSSAALKHQGKLPPLNPETP
ncbi:MAG: BatD family protein [Candidatus Sedimenticola sp. (ex Thyasira tokunagai)]